MSLMMWRWLLVAAVVGVCAGEEARDLRRREVCLDGSLTGCATAVQYQGQRRNSLMQCVGLSALSEVVPGVEYRCPAQQFPQCVDTVDGVTTDLPEWVEAPLVHDNRPSSGPEDLVVIIVSTERSKFAERIGAAAATWVRRLDPRTAIVVVGDSYATLPAELQQREETHLLQWQESYARSAPLYHAMLGDVLEMFENRNFFLKVDDTSLVVPGNLYRFLDVLGPFVPADEPVLFGKGNCNAADSAQPCYPLGTFGLNAVALELLVSRMDTGCHSSGVRPDGEPDLVATKCLADQGVPLVSCGHFRAHNPAAYLKAFPSDPERAKRILRERILEGGLISFQNVESTALHYLDRFLYGGDATANRPVEGLVRSKASMAALEAKCSLSAELWSTSRMKCE